MVIPNVPIYRHYADVIRSQFPNGAGRSQMAELFEVDKTTAVYHLQKCVKKGLLVRVYAWVSSNQRGWVYFTPEHLQTLSESDGVQWSDVQGVGA